MLSFFLSIFYSSQTYLAAFDVFIFSINHRHISHGKLRRIYRMNFALNFEFCCCGRLNIWCISWIITQYNIVSLFRKGATLKFSSLLFSFFFIHAYSIFFHFVTKFAKIFQDWFLHKFWTHTKNGKKSKKIEKSEQRKKNQNVFRCAE